MTETADIKALRKQAETAKVCGGMFAISGEKAIAILDQLEAERRRAERGEAAAGIIQQMYNELKGDQVPVEYQIYYHNHGTGAGEWCRVRTKARYEELQIEHAGDNDFSFRTLFTASQNLVVRPRLEPCLKQVQFERDCEWIEAIKAAGGIVKDGE